MRKKKNKHARKHTYNSRREKESQKFLYVLLWHTTNIFMHARICVFSPFLLGVIPSFLLHGVTVFAWVPYARGVIEVFILLINSINITHSYLMLGLIVPSRIFDTAVFFSNAVVCCFWKLIVSIMRSAWVVLFILATRLMRADFLRMPEYFFRVIHCPVILCVWYFLCPHPRLNKRFDWSGCRSGGCYRFSNPSSFRALSSLAFGRS